MRNLKYPKPLKSASASYYQIICKTDEHPAPADKNKMFYNHCHNYYEALLFIEGDAELVLENNKYRLRPYTLVLIKPQEYHHINPVADKRYVRMVLSFDSAIVSEEVLSKIFAHSIVRLEAGNELTQMLEQYRHSHLTFNTIDRQRYKKACLMMFLFTLSQQITYLSAAAPESLHVNPLIKDCIDYINANFQKNIGLSSIAKQFFVSKYYLSTVFSKHINITISDYINYKRILHAQNLIQKGTPPNEVYLLSGFNNYTTFYRLYKKHLGCTPSQHKPRSAR